VPQEKKQLTKCRIVLKGVKGRIERRMTARPSEFRVPVPASVHTIEGDEGRQ
jgi:hypothetical protein